MLSQDNIRQPEAAFCFMSGATYIQIYLHIGMITQNALKNYPDVHLGALPVRVDRDQLFIVQNATLKKTDRGCQIFIGMCYQNRKNVPN
jgi:uncharacterized cupin superfamily protein